MQRLTREPVFLAPEIKIVSLHARTWLDGANAGDICARDQDALIFNKPVIFDDDADSGADETRKSNLNDTQVQKWAEQVSESGTNSCGQSKGRLHFYHTKDAAVLESTPTRCRYDDVAPPPTVYVDCFAWNALADGVREKFCGTAPGLTNCVARQNYCENYQGNPPQCSPVQDGIPFP